MSKLFTSDSFPNDWYGWLTNQVSHIFLGLFSVFVLSMAGFVVMGEFPVKTHMLALIFVLYLGAAEIWLQGWRGWDTIEDTVFVVVYGAAGPLSASAEIEAGNSAIIMDLEPLLPYFYVFVAHLIAGVLWRVSSK
jgi:hypothetical protein